MLVDTIKDIRSVCFDRMVTREKQKIKIYNNIVVVRIARLA